MKWSMIIIMMLALLSPLGLHADVFDAVFVDVSLDSEAGMTVRGGLDVFALADTQDPFDRLAEQNAMVEARKATGSTATGHYVPDEPEDLSIWGNMAMWAKEHPKTSTVIGIGATVLSAYGGYKAGESAGWWGDTGGGGGDSQPDAPGDDKPTGDTIGGDQITITSGDGSSGDITVSYNAAPAN